MLFRVLWLWPFSHSFRFSRSHVLAVLVVLCDCGWLWFACYCCEAMNRQSFYSPFYKLFIKQNRINRNIWCWLCKFPRDCYESMNDRWISPYDLSNARCWSCCVHDIWRGRWRLCHFESLWFINLPPNGCFFNDFPPIIPFLFCFWEKDQNMQTIPSIPPSDITVKDSIRVFSS